MDSVLVIHPWSPSQINPISIKIILHHSVSLQSLPTANVIDMYALLLLASHHLSLTIMKNRVDNIWSTITLGDPQELVIQCFLNFCLQSLRHHLVHLYCPSNKRYYFASTSFQHLVWGYLAPPFDSSELHHWSHHGHQLILSFLPLFPRSTAPWVQFIMLLIVLLFCHIN